MPSKTRYSKITAAICSGKESHMYAQILSAAIRGLSVIPVQVEADVSDGLPQFVMVGDLNSQVKEARDRVLCALKNSGIRLPARNITINLSPADVPKFGCAFDLPIALATLAAAGQLPISSLKRVMALGELGLDGRILPVPGVLPTALLAKEEKLSLLIVPRENLDETSVAGGLAVTGVHTVRELIDELKNGTFSKAPTPAVSLSAFDRYDVDFSEIRGQETVKRAALIAAAGFHNLLLVGPPGAGKSMVAKRMPTILPPLSMDESLEISKIYSIAGLLDATHPLITTRPFRHPHHTSSAASLAGGGINPHPGEITLAHRGVLFLDELPEFPRSTLEILRQPLEDREIVISRSAGSFRFPASFLLLAAMNPCPCGYFGDARCHCTHAMVQRYQSKISKPLLDRIDLSVLCHEVGYDDLHPPKKKTPDSISSKTLRDQVLEAMERERARFKGTPLHFNSEIPSSKIESYCPMTPDAESILEQIFRSHHLSARAYYRVLRVSRTIADLDGSEKLKKQHLLEALSYKLQEGLWKL